MLKFSAPSIDYSIFITAEIQDTGTENPTENPRDLVEQTCYHNK